MDGPWLRAATGPHHDHPERPCSLLSSSEIGEVENSEKGPMGQTKQLRSPRTWPPWPGAEELHHDQVILEVGQGTQKERQRQLPQKDLAMKANERP